MEPTRNEVSAVGTTDPASHKATYDSLLNIVQTKSLILLAGYAVGPLMLSARFYIMNPYLKSISTWDTSTIANIVSLCFVIDAVMGFFCTWLGDRYGYSTMLFVVYAMNCIGTVIESVSDSASVFSFGLFIGSVSISPHIVALGANLLPQRQYGKFLSNMFAVIGVAYCSGPLIAALLSDFVAMRSVFISISFLSCTCFCLMLYFMWNIERELHMLLRHSLPEQFVAQQDNLDVFPLYYAEKKPADRREAGANLLRDMEASRIIALLIAVVQVGLCWGSEAMFLFCIVRYMTAKYPDQDMSMLNITSVYGFFLIAFIFGTTLTPRFIETVVPKRLNVITYSALAWCLCCVALYMNSSSIWAERCLMAGFAISMGIVAISAEMSQVEVQPKQFSGFVEGLKIMMMGMSRAVCVLSTGYLLAVCEPNVMWIVIFVCALISLILAIIRNAFIDVEIADASRSLGARISNEESGYETGDRFMNIDEEQPLLCKD